MIYQHPLIALLFCVVLLLIVLMQSFTKRHFLKTKFFISLVLTLLAVLALIFNSQIENDELLKSVISWCLFGLDIVVSLVMLSMIDVSMSAEKFHHELTKSINETKYFVLLDKKDRIKEISDLFLQDLEIETDDDVYGKNFFDILEKKYRIIGFNNQEAYKKDLKKYYEHYERRVHEGDKNPIAIQLQTRNGKSEKALYFTETVVFSNEKYRGRILFGDSKTEDNLIGMEKDLERKSEELDIIMERFNAVLNHTEDCVFFHSITNQSIWVNDTLKTKLNLSDNEIPTTTFLSLIHPDDIALYRERVKNLEDDEYEFSYRFNNGSYYVYVKEKGNIIRNGKLIELCGVMSVYDNDSFQTTGTDLDHLGTDNELAVKVKDLLGGDRVFLVAHFYIDGIPEINEKYGRVIGNYMLANYIRIFKQNFIDDNKLYRVGGLEFIGIITDYRKMDILKTNLANKDKLYHLKADYMGKKIEANVYIGLSYTNDTHSPKEVLKNARESLKICRNKQFNSNYAYYKDIH